jgi:hypothetical protein
MHFNHYLLFAFHQFFERTLGIQLEFFLFFYHNASQVLSVHELLVDLNRRHFGLLTLCQAHVVTSDRHAPRLNQVSALPIQPIKAFVAQLCLHIARPTIHYGVAFPWRSH